MASDDEARESTRVVVDEPRQRLEWNSQMFEELGFQPEIAELLASEKVDWHEAERLVEKGCSLNQILRILL